MALVFALPLALPLFQSFRHADGGYGLGYEIAFFAEPFNIGVLMRRLRVAFLTTLLALVIGARTLGLNRMVQGQGLHLTAAICAIAADAGRSCL